MRPDGELLNASPPESGSYLAEWSRRYRRALLSFFRRRMPPGDHQEDLIQEVFVRLAQRRDLHEIRDVDRYLFQSAANVLVDWRRRQITHAADAHDPLENDIEGAGCSPERVLIGKDLLNRLIAAVSAMPERTQSVFVLYHFEHKTHAEIGRELGIAVRTVEDHMARANALLQHIDDER